VILAYPPLQGEGPNGVARTLPQSFGGTLHGQVGLGPFQYRRDRFESDAAVKLRAALRVGAYYGECGP
jgi:hypothetical protein